tara:strand:+ start:2398 stop:2844 length:447 start_codon:yes stop_codon:yes gene_type:complete
MMTTILGAIAPPDRYVVGMGFASAATADEIIALLESCLAVCTVDGRQLVAIGTHMRKLGSPLLLSVALHFGVPLRLFDQDDLRDAGPGVADAVASLAGPLQLRKQKSDFATCAIARCAPGFSLAGFGQPYSASATMASSTLLTSIAGP